MTDPHREPTPGCWIGPYEILDVAGQGGMGRVYRARDSRLGREVAIKCLDRALADDAVARMRFAREARSAARLSHPHIVQLHEVFDHDGLPWLVMQFVQGPTLRDVIDQRGALSTEDVLRWAEQLASALEHAHERRILHRDIKPRNILITSDGQALLTDFGLARVLAQDDLDRTTSRTPDGSSSTGTTDSNITWSGAIVGTPAYMSPEQAFDRPLDERSDLFSLGLVLYEMCTGRPLFAHGELRAVLEERVRHEPPDLRRTHPAVPVELERIVKKTLSLRPEDRHPSAHALRQDLRAFRLRLESPSRRGARLALGTSLAVLLVLVGIAVFRPPTERPRAPDVVATAIVTWPSREAEGRISPDKRWLSFLSDRDGGFRLWLRSLDGDLEQPLTAAEESIESHVWSGDGTEIAYLADAGSRALLRAVPALGGPPRTLATLDARYTNARLVRWIATRIYIELEQTLQRFEVRTQQLEELVSALPPPAARVNFDVRSDERRIVYRSSSVEGPVLWTSDLDGDNPRPLPGAPHEPSARWPLWVGSEVVYTSNRSGQPDLWGVDPETGADDRITLSPWTEEATDASPDGSILAFVHQIDSSHLWSVERGGGDERQLTADALGDSWASSGLASGAQVAFQRAKPSFPVADSALETQILVGEVGRDRLTDARVVTVNGEQPVLSPNGEWLTYARDRELWVHDLHTGEALLATSEYAVSARRLFPFTLADHNVEWAPSSKRVYFATRSTAGAALRFLSVDPRAESKEVEPPTPRTLLRDLRASPDDASLAYVVVDPTGQELRCRELASGDERVLLRTERLIRPFGWAGRDTVLVAVATTHPDSTQALELLAIGRDGASRRLASIDRAYADTLLFDPASGDAYVTALTAPDVHNIVEISLTDGRTRTLTNNRLPGVGFTAFRRLPDGTLLHARQERAEDIWIVESVRRD